MTSPVGAPYDPTGQPFPDLDGSGSLGPLRIQLSGEVLSHEITFKSNDGDKGVLAKLIDAAWWLKGNVNAATTAAIDAVTTRINTITGGAGPSVSVTRMSGTLAVPVTPADWTSIAGDGDWITSVNTATDLVLPLSAEALPHGTTLTGVSVSLTPAVHASIAGLTLPVIKLYSISFAGIPTQIGATTSDTSASAGAYSVNHSISITGLSTVIDRSANRYAIVFTSEHTGGNAASGCGVYGAKATHSSL